MDKVSEIGLARKAVIKGNSEEAFTILFELLQDIERKELRDIYNELCIHSNNFNQLEKSKRLEIISNEHFTQKSNQITSFLIESINEIEGFVEEQKLEVKKIDLNNTFTIPRNFISDRHYLGFVIIGFSLGLATSIVFMILFYGFIRNGQGEIKELLFIASIGVLALLFLFGSFDGLNKQKKYLVDMRIILPLLITFLSLIISIALLSIS